MKQLLFTLFSFSISTVLADGAQGMGPVGLHQFVPSSSNVAVGTPSGSVSVRVRAIRALGAFQQGEIDASSMTPAEERLQGLDPKLLDLKDKLAKLQYHRFRLLTQQAAEIPLRKKQTIPLISGQTLTLRPLYVDGQKIGLWLRWKDPTGSDILDTRLHFDNESSMITGTEAAADSGIILAIDVK